MESIYFISYASIASVSFIVVLQAMWERRTREGRAINWRVLQALGGATVALWLASGFTAIGYA